MSSLRQVVCEFSEVLDGAGVCAQLGREQVAIFRLGDEVFALENLDPFSGAQVLSRGLVGDLQGQLVVASPVYKQHFNLRSGRCLEDEAVSLKTYRCGVEGKDIWVELPQVTMPRGRDDRKKLVVVGNGMAAMRTVEELLKVAPDKYQITVFGAEPRGNYNRILLSPLLAGDLDQAQLMLHPSEWYAQQGIRLHAGDSVVTIDRKRRQVQSAAGHIAAYDRLLLATGSTPVRLKLPGSDLPGVCYFRSLDDVETMLEKTGNTDRAVVIGGGLLGLEAASGLARQGLTVTVVHLRDRVMDKQLDPEAAVLLQQAMETRSVKFRLGARTAGFEGQTQLEGVRLESGEVLACGLVVIAAGILPHTDLARESGLKCDRGILVDDTLQTFDPAIYAVGECVQHRGVTFGLVAPLWEQARVCAQHLAEQGVSRFRGSQPTSQLKVSGIDVFSAGDIRGLMQSEPLRFSDPAAKIYKRLWVKDNQLKAAVLFGETRQAAWYSQLIERQQDVSGIRQQLLWGDGTSTAA